MREDKISQGNWVEKDKVSKIVLGKQEYLMFMAEDGEIKEETRKQ